MLNALSGDHLSVLAPAEEVAVLGRELPGGGILEILQAIRRGLVLHWRGMQRARRSAGVARQLEKVSKSLATLGSDPSWFR